MTDLLLFHHALGVTAGMDAFADDLRAAGHRVVVPDLFDGATFDSIAAGVGHAQSVGFDKIIDRGVAEADELGDRFAVAGFSLGALPAQKLAQTDSRVAGAILYHAAVPISTFGNAWPAGVALQVHIGEDDEWAEEDLGAARELTAESGGELFLYPGPGHLITDSSFADHHPRNAARILERTLAFLDSLG